MPDKTPHQFFSAADLLTLKDDPERWIVPFMIPKANKTIVFGEGGAYKSTIIFDLCVAIASGGQLLRQFPVKHHGTVLLISTEGSIYDNRDRILAHCRAHNVNPAEINLHFCQEPFLLDDPSDVAELSQTIAHFKPLLVVLDPLDSFFAGDENSAKETKALRRAIDQLQREHECAFIIIHHQTKAKESVRGSSAWFGWADSVLHVKKEVVRLQGPTSEPRDMVSVNSQKLRNGKSGHVFSVVPQKDDVFGMITFALYDGRAPAAVADDFFLHQVYRAIRLSPAPLTNAMIAEQLSARLDRLPRFLTQLEVDGFIAKDAVVERATGEGTRRVAAWRVLPRLSLVDAALSLVKARELEIEQDLSTYSVSPQPVGSAVVEPRDDAGVRAQGVAGEPGLPKPRV
jgi:hypothetical protein